MPLNFFFFLPQWKVDVPRISQMQGTCTNHTHTRCEEKVLCEDLQIKRHSYHIEIQSVCFLVCRQMYARELVRTAHVNL